VADPGIKKIDGFFDMVDSLVDHADRVFNRTQRVEDQHQARRTSRTRQVDQPAQGRSTSTEIAPRRFRLVEAIAPETGLTIFVVTNGAERAECSSRGLAEKILHFLGTVP
jgi:D-lyxose ketol-isomerase